MQAPAGSFSGNSVQVGDLSEQQQQEIVDYLFGLFKFRWEFRRGCLVSELMSWQEALSSVTALSQQFNNPKIVHSTISRGSYRIQLDLSLVYQLYLQSLDKIARKKAKYAAQ